MNIAEVCKSRKILPHEIETPLLVPSFSSKGFSSKNKEGKQQVQELHTYLKPHLLDASLVSSYDLYYQNITTEDIYVSDIIFIDSGGYERSEDIELAEIYNKKYIPKPWNFDLFSQTINGLQPLVPLTLVNYDPEEKISFRDQISNARNFFKGYQEHASDFLCKPAPNSPEYIDVDQLIQHTNLLSQFSIIGFTEKELGDSVFNRCKSIFKIRKNLSDLGINTPIHIFGCLDPLNILAYFFCGADIFDGLSWLRFIFKDGIASYINSSAIISGKWLLEDSRLKAILYAENLQELTKLMADMRYFTSAQDLSAFNISPAYINQVKHLVERVGIKF